MKHILRYGSHADKKFINQNTQYYDTMLFNANMIAYSSKAICKFINTNLLQKSYFIDPQTNAFQYSLDYIKSKGKNDEFPTLKKSYKDLASSYGDMLSQIVITDDRKLEISDFNDDFIDDFCKSVLSFQHDRIYEYSKKENFTEFLNYTELDKLKPEFLIIPYFSIDYESHEWIDINKKLVKKSSQIYNASYSDMKLSAQLVITLDALQDNIDDIIDSYLTNGIKNLMLWIDDFSESEKNKTELISFARIVKKFYINDISVINLYGGYFSAILGHFENDLGFKFAGLAHGLEYGEHRKFAPVGGGIPKAKYYYYDLHQRIEPPTMIDILNYRKINTPKEYFDNICDCKICKDVIINNVDMDFFIFLNSKFYTIESQKTRRTYPSRETRRVSLLHYLENKVIEFENLHEISNIDHLITILDSSYSLHRKGFFSESSHLNTWINTLRDLLDS